MPKQYGHTSRNFGRTRLPWKTGWIIIVHLNWNREPRETASFMGKDDRSGLGHADVWSNLMERHLVEGTHWTVRNEEPGLRRKIGAGGKSWSTSWVLFFLDVWSDDHTLEGHIQLYPWQNLISSCGPNASPLLNDLKLWCHCPISDFNFKPCHHSHHSKATQAEDT